MWRLAFVLLAGCSLAVRAPRPTAPGVPPDCTSSRVLPVLDLAFGIPSLLASGFIFYRLSASNATDKDEAQKLAFGLAAYGGVATLAGGLGVRTTSQCRAAKAAFVAAPGLR